MSFESWRIGIARCREGARGPLRKKEVVSRRNSLHPLPLNHTIPRARQLTVYRFLCTAAPPAPLRALSIDPSVQQLPSPTPTPSPSSAAATPPPPSPLDLARALDNGEPVTATVRPLQSKVVVATSATVWLLPPTSSSPLSSPARALWVAPALEQRLVQAGAVVRPSPLCPYSPACRVAELEPHGVPGQVYRIVASTAVTVLVAAAPPPADSAAAGEEGQQQQHHHHLLTASSAGGLLLTGAGPNPLSSKATSSLSRASSSSATSNITRRPQQQAPRAVPAPPTSAARAAAGRATGAGPAVVSARTAAAAAAAASKQRQQQRARAPSPSSSSASASPVAASSAFGLLDALGSDD